jgi:hypothetical protein
MVMFKLRFVILLNLIELEITDRQHLKSLTSQENKRRLLESMENQQELQLQELKWRKLENNPSTTKDKRCL